MNKRTFLKKLGKGLRSLSKAEAEERLSFYAEMIDDRMEEGIDENDAVAQVGRPDEIAAGILSEKLQSKTGKQENGNRCGKVKTILMILGSPVWVSVLISVIAVIVSVYISLWACIFSLWAGVVSLWAGALSGFIAGILYLTTGHGATGLAAISAGLVCAGLSVYMYCLCSAASKWLMKAAVRMAGWLKRLFAGKEARV